VTDLICKTIKERTLLVHVSLSHNDFLPEESVKIAEVLNKNQTIYGFHFEGHQGYSDNLGFYHPTKYMPLKLGYNGKQQCI
jgi:hypothetical protein